MADNSHCDWPLEYDAGFLYAIVIITWENTARFAWITSNWFVHRCFDATGAPLFFRFCGLLDTSDNMVKKTVAVVNPTIQRIWQKNVTWWLYVSGKL